MLFIVQTLISWLCAFCISKILRLKRRPRNFVTAMSVFGNSNSLPISLVLSLSHTLSGLHWSALPRDNDSDVAGRGILYLLLFQQLGQALRWSWGYHSLLKPKSQYPEYRDEVLEEGAQPAVEEPYSDEDTNPAKASGSSHSGSQRGSLTPGDNGATTPGQNGESDDHDHDQFSPAGRTPVPGSSSASAAESDDEAEGSHSPRKPNPQINEPGSGENDDAGAAPQQNPEIVPFPHITKSDADAQRTETFIKNFKAAWARKVDSAKCSTRSAGHRVYDRLPKPLRRACDIIDMVAGKVHAFLYKYMNPPLWSMFLAIIVASVPSLQSLFFDKGTFMKNSVTTAIESLGGVAVPLILVVLGANLARKTQDVESRDPEEAALGRKLLVSSLVTRMALVPLLMGPFLGLVVKFIPVGIFGDPIFVVVCFLLMGAPSALQLAQICQLNEVFEGVMAKILFHSYVIW